MLNLFKVIFVLHIFLLPKISLATIEFTNGKWESTFDCPDWIQHQPYPGAEPDCDGIQRSLDQVTVNNSVSSISLDSNNPNGPGGKGLRLWKGSEGDNDNSGMMAIIFPSPQPEIWIRYYYRYENGFAYLDNLDTKEIYMKIGGYNEWGSWNNSNAIGFNHELFRTYSYSVPYPSVAQSWYGFVGKNWNYVHPNGISDGTWKVMEIYLKMDTNGGDNSPYADGIMRAWFDGELIMDANNANWSGGDTDHRQGWMGFEWINNQKDPGLSRDYYVDVDDWSIYNTVPPNLDSQDNPIIGPIDWVSGADITAHGSPSGLFVL